MQLNFSVVGGVYYITNIFTGSIYVGSTRDAVARAGQHATQLDAGRGSSLRLQNEWLTWGRDAFTFVLVEHCDPSMRAARERKHMLGLLAAGNRLLNDKLPTPLVSRGRPTRAVRCIDTGAAYESVAAAALAVGLASSAPIVNAIRTARRSAGYLWEYA